MTTTRERLLELGYVDGAAPTHLMREYDGCTVYARPINEAMWWVVQLPGTTEVNPGPILPVPTATLERVLTTIHGLATATTFREAAESFKSFLDEALEDPAFAALFRGPA